ncbi:peptide MFS transporter [Sphingomonas solaris]|uniref:Peptide MFS transporter n=1 Tax=Alterirhizorhabdus solaris TaxID=2529389 RepID=A0A558QRF7_9SPHN|nr:peptide MFS transporter [Sphingomonas solaris]TVV69721.1 peptide MFS transporter [Sphingomonas solaris]
MATLSPTLPDDDRAFLGHPRGLAYLAFAEAWERFSFYGMQALLVLYMVGQLLLPGHVENVAGFPAFRAALEGAYGPLSVQALASAIFGLYAGLIYLTPILGGLLADRVLGRTRTVTLGAMLMVAGHFLMAFDVSFLIALACLILGCGCFKGNIAAQVGGLYASGDLRRADAFQIYYLGINGGVIAAPLICGTLGELYGWHYGFGAAGVGMLLGLAIYLAGRRYLPPETTRGTRGPKVALAPGEGKTIALLIGLLPVLAVAVCGNMQIFNAYLVWAQESVDFTLFGRTMPTTWLITLDSITSVAFLVGAVAFWRLWARRFPEPDEITKIALGTMIALLAPLVLAACAAHAAATGVKTPVAWLIVFHVVNSIGIANVFPVALALYSRASPPALGSTIIGIFYLHFFAANMLVGWLGGKLDAMPAASFWLMHAGLIGVAGLLLLGARALFGHLLAPAPLLDKSGHRT